MNKWLLFLLLLPCLLGAVDVQMEPREVYAGDEFSFNVILSPRELSRAEGTADLKLPKGLKQISKADSNKIFRDVWGQRVKRRVISFRLKATSEGHFRPELIWKIGKETKSGGQVSIPVQRSTSAAGLTVQTRVDKTTLYEGEQFRLNATYRIYPNFSPSEPYSPVQESFGPQISGSFNRDKAGKLQRDSKGRFQYQTIPAYLVANASGTITIPPLKYRYKKIGKPKRVEKTVQRGSFTQTMVTVKQEEIDATATSNSLRLKVKPLPEKGRPAYFKGAVGSYKLKVTLAEDSIARNGVVRLQVKVSGDGRPGNINGIQLPDLSNFRQVPPENKTRTYTRRNKVITEKTLDYVLYPKSPGEFVIEPIRFAFFNIKSKQYEILSSDTLNIKVGMEESDSPMVMSATPSTGEPQAEIKKVFDDIRHINTNPADLKDNRNLPYQQVWFWVALLVAMLFIPLNILIKRWLKVRSEDLVSRRRGGSRSKLSKRFSLAQKALTSEQLDDFWLQINAALDKYVSDICNKEFTGMTNSQIEEYLLEKGVEPELITEYRNFRSRCEMARFGKASNLDDARQSMEVAQTLAKKMGKVL